MKISPYLLSALVALVVAAAATVSFAHESVRRLEPEQQATPSPPRLSSYGVDIRQTSVSGVSSGGVMAIQMHVAHSAIMRGVGVIAGVSYDCADSRFEDVKLRLLRGLSCLAGNAGAEGQFSVDRTNDAAGIPGAIDPISNLRGQKVWLFSGYNDGSVRREAMNAVAAYYRHFVDAGNVFYQTDNRAPHALVTDSFGGPCLGFNDQYINNCGYDAAGHLLRYIYGHLNPRSSNPGGKVLSFDQREFTGGVPAKSIGLAETGYAYVPAACAAQNPQPACRVHVVFHGCRQYAENPQIGTAVVEHGGYNQWADTNRLIVLYPQAVPTPPSVNSAGVELNPGNPRGCWDWWGYTDLPRSRDFARKTGYQVAAIKAMIDRLAQGFVPDNTPPSFGPPGSASVDDKTTTMLVLIWQWNTAATGFKIYRSSSTSGPFVPIANLVNGASFVDTALARNTEYHYEIRAVDASNTESAPVRLSGRTAATEPPSCDPYFSDNLTHIASYRAFVTIAGVHAVGSLDPMGPALDTHFSQLTKDAGPLPVYRVRYCP